jgi:hypothetical protein
MVAVSQEAYVISDGVVVNVASFDTDFAYNEWLQLAEQEYDEVRMLPVASAGIGWTVEPDGTLRMPSPYPSWSWVDGDWVAPVPKPDGETYEWDETAGEWKPVEAP